eukprot:scaffold122643_cov33-Tisochrysis_lutea.AAC.4
MVDVVDRHRRDSRTGHEHLCALCSGEAGAGLGQLDLCGEAVELGCVLREARRRQCDRLSSPHRGGRRLRVQSTGRRNVQVGEIGVHIPIDGARHRQSSGYGVDVGKLKPIDRWGSAGVEVVVEGHVADLCGVIDSADGVDSVDGLTARPADG